MKSNLTSCLLIYLIKVNLEFIDCDKQISHNNALPFRKGGKEQKVNSVYIQILLPLIRIVNTFFLSNQYQLILRDKVVEIMFFKKFSHL